MATTSGRVLSMLWSGQSVCIGIGLNANNMSLLILQFRTSDSALALASKRLLAKTLATALHAGLRVSAAHGASDSVITSVSFEPLEFSLAGPAIHNDYLSVAGSNIPNNADIVFEAGALQVALTPDLRRPHWLLVASLPGVVPTGRCQVFLRAGAWRSSSVPVVVSAGPPMRRRVLYSGRPTTGAYTIAFVASPGRESGMNVLADGILSDRGSFQTMVRHCLQNLLAVDESLLRDGNLDRTLRFVVIFDTSRTAETKTALIREVSPDILEPTRNRVGAFAAAYWERPDVVFCISASTTFDRASAFFTTDEGPSNAASYAYDATNRGHGLRAQIPGTIAQSTSMDMTGLTPLHEFVHAASDFDNGKVIDLYVDGSAAGFVVNKKLRAASTDPVPTNFATAMGSTYAADATRDGVSYNAGWTSYHPALQVTNRPNLMDNYWLAGANARSCRLDGLTFDWLLRRIRAKAGRPE